MHKTAKSRLLDLFNLDPIAEKPPDNVSLVDMGLIWRLAIPTPDDREARKRDGSEYRWSDYMDKICSITLSPHVDARLIILVNDKYDIPFSIKNDEPDRRAAKYQQIPNVSQEPSDPFPSAVEFNKLMVNSGNKVRLQTLLKERMKAQVCRLQTNVIYCAGENSTNLSTGTVSQDCVFKQPEADTMLFSAYAKLRAENYTGAVVLDSADTDVYVQAAYVSQQLRGDLMIKHKHTLINCKTLLSHEVAQIIIPLHVITGSDQTSGFYRHGKKQVLQKLITDHQARELLSRVGESGVGGRSKIWYESICPLKSLYWECCYLQARQNFWVAQTEKEEYDSTPTWRRLLESPHAKDELHHVLPAPLRTVTASFPVGHGWESVNGKSRPVRHTLPPLPQLLIRRDFSEDTSNNNDSNDETSECEESTDSDEQ